ncbi:hypothetical protein ACJRW5_19125 [Pseudomonas sp. SH1-B]
MAPEDHHFSFFLSKWSGDRRIAKSCPTDQLVEGLCATLLKLLFHQVHTNIPDLVFSFWFCGRANPRPAMGRIALKWSFGSE